MVNYFKHLTIFEKNSTLDVQQGSQNAPNLSFSKAFSKLRTGIKWFIFIDSNLAVYVKEIRYEILKLFHLIKSLSDLLLTLRHIQRETKSYCLFCQFSQSKMAAAAKKLKLLLRISTVNMNKSAVICGLVTFNEESLNRKLHFLCSVQCK